MHSLNTLEWQLITTHLSKRTRCALGHALALSLLPSADAAKRRNQTKEAVQLLGDYAGFVNLWDSVENPVSFLIAASKDSVLSAREIYICSHFFETVGFVGNDLRRIKANAPTSCPLLISDWEMAPTAPPLCSTVRNSVNSEGHVLDTASSLLLSLRNQRASKRSKFEHFLDSKIKQWAESGILQDNFYDVVDGRYVIPVKVGEQTKIHGALHGKSNTGQSVFIEPAELTSANNELKELELAIQSEEFRILKELSRAIAPFASTYEPWIEHLAALDLVFASARLAIDWDLTAANSSQTEFNLKNVFHPSLKDKNPVKNSVRLPQADHAGAGLLISGPNTGGKTVLLKAMGLCALMNQSGLFIPASEGSVLPEYREIIAFIGDDQNIEKGLSSFSAQIADLKTVLEKKRFPCLILVDEILSSTDPEEASALAQSLIESFIDDKHHVIVTTHFSDLSLRLKTHAQIYLAGMEFHKGAPTYRILPDELGSSHAIEVAEKLGLPAKIIDRARSLLSQNKVDWEKLRAELRHKEQQLIEESNAVKASFESARKTLEAEYDRKKQTLEATLTDFMRSAEEKVRVAVSSVSERLSEFADKGKGAAKNAEANLKFSLQSILDRIQEEKSTALAGTELADLAPMPTAKEEIKVGDQVMVQSLAKATGVVLSLDKKTTPFVATLQVGNFKVEKPVTDLALKQVPLNTTGCKSKGYDASPSSYVPLKCDLRGVRYEEAMAQAESYLDNAFRCGHPQVTVVTGHGTGAIKNGLKELLKNLPYIQEFHAEHQSNDGALRIIFDR